MKTVWLAGGSGLVGGLVLRRLLDETASSVVAVGRRALPVQHARLLQAQVDFGSAAPFEALPAPDAALSCLGSTIRKAGSREAFRAVDLLAVLTFARAARARGARAFVHVSSLGADPRSRVFYSAVKGEAEEGVAALGFESCSALRPSLLDGEREERRPGERALLLAARALGPLLGRYRPTPAGDVAALMVRLALDPEPGTRAIDARQIHAR